MTQIKYDMLLMLIVPAEIVENSKEGYESDVMEDEGISKDSSSSASSSSAQTWLKYQR